MGMPHDKRRLYRKMINCARSASSRPSVPNEVTRDKREHQKNPIPTTVVPDKADIRIRSVAITDRLSSDIDHFGNT